MSLAQAKKAKEIMQGIEWLGAELGGGAVGVFPLDGVSLTHVDTVSHSPAAHGK